MTDSIKIVRTADDYKAALGKIEALIDRGARKGTAEANELEVLSVLAGNYEDERAGSFTPDPIEAIKFRMEQQNLTPRDLVPFLGSRSKVSEVLSQKRPLTLSMIRALHTGLGIPAISLLRDQPSFGFAEPEFDWSSFPLDEMAQRGWIEAKGPNWKLRAEEIMRSFFAPMGSPSEAFALYKHTHAHVRGGRALDEHARIAWTARIMSRAIQSPPPAEYEPGSITLDFMRELARLSTFDVGPKLAVERLAQHGITVIVEGHLLRTYLDGAATMLDQKRPVIGLTLRHDRIDNFWHVLMHELAHVARHFTKGRITFYDDLDVGDRGDSREKEADEMAREALVPHKVWVHSPASRLRTPIAAKDLAEKLGIHPAIVAGHIRHHWKSYRKLSQMVGHGLVRQLFKGEKWSDVA